MKNGALLVIDVQNEYIKRYEAGLLERINKRIEKAVADNEVIIYIENVKTLRGKEKTSPLADGLLIAFGSVFEKRKASAFSNTELVNCLKERGITVLEIIGIDGNCCVSATAKEAVIFAPDVIVNCDCIGSLNNLRFDKTKETLNGLGVHIL